MWFTILKNKILDIVFPIHCLNCGKANQWICEDCMSFVEFHPVFLCPRCGNRSYLGRVCKRCEGKSYLDGLIAMDKYGNPLMKNLIKSLKFRYITDLEPVLNRLVKRFCLKYSEIFPLAKAGENIILIPVPLHPLRFRQRGFNQAEFISKFVSEALGYKISKVLKRVRYTYRQSELPEDMKKSNIKDAFQYVRHPERSEAKSKDLAPSHTARQAGAERPANNVPQIVILVDDVYTSGFTMQECARTLKNAGAKEVWGFVLAR